MIETFEDNFPNAVKTEGECIRALKDNVFALALIPEALKTERVCQEAIDNISIIGGKDIEILYLIRNPDLIYKNLDRLFESFDAEEIMFNLHPSVKEDDKILDWAIERDGRCIHHAPPEKQTEARLEQAIDNSGLTIFGYDTVNKSILSKPGIIEKGINYANTSFNYIPPKLVTPEHCLLQDKLYPSYFNNYPEKLPERIKNEINIFTLSKTLENLTKEKFSYDDVIAINSGRRVQKGNVIFEYKPHSGEIRLKVPRSKVEDNDQKRKMKL